MISPAAPCVNDKQSSQETKPFRVLSLDGGGMRGLYTATVLQTIATHYAKKRNVKALDVGLGFDLIVGTSTGGILASALAFGLPLESLANLYRVEGPKIFSDPMPDIIPADGVISGLWRNKKIIKWLLRNIAKPANKNHHLRETLTGFFGTESLADLYSRRKIGLCIPSVRAEQQTAKVFKTPHLERFTMDGEYSLVDVCMATSAAPIYLPLVDIKDPRGETVVFSDGGLWANNPIFVAVLEALELTAKSPRPIQILSLSTCPAPEGEVILPGKEGYGLMQWRAGTKIVSLSLNAQANGSDYMANLLQNRLRERGCDLNITRLRSSALSLSQIQKARLDSATPDALRILGQMGLQDGGEAIRLCDGGGASRCKDGQLLHDVFQEMPELKLTETQGE